MKMFPEIIIKKIDWYLWNNKIREINEKINKLYREDVFYGVDRRGSYIGPWFYTGNILKNVFIPPNCRCHSGITMENISWIEWINSKIGEMMEILI